MEDSFLHIGGIIVCLILSAFFSGSEIAFFSLSKIQLKKIEKKKSSSSKRVFKLLKSPRKLLITILFGNTIVNIVAVSLAAIVTIRISDGIAGGQYKELMLLVEVVVMTVILLLVGEVTPKLLSFTKAESMAEFSGFILNILMIVLYPIIKLLEWISIIFARKEVTTDHQSSRITSEDIRNLISSKTTYHSLDESEKKMIANIIRLPSTHASEIMIPRVDIVGVEINDDIDEVKRIISESGHSRIPVYKNIIDNIVGFIYAKDLIMNDHANSIHKLMRKPVFATENMSIQNLLNFFKAAKIHIAIVVDEYGGTAGLITLEDILEEVFGEIMDEHDNELPRKIKVSSEEYILSGMYGVAELNAEFELDLDEDQYDNLAEFLYGEFNRVPKKNERIQYGGKAIFTVANIKKNRINYVRMKLVEKKDEE